jgi:hypothetical protein
MAYDTTLSAQLPPKALARVRLDSRRRRARTIRRTVVTSAVAAFIAAWGLIYGQLVTGKDPVLKASATHAAKQSSATTSSSTPQASGPSSTSITPTPVTTSQS